MAPSCAHSGREGFSDLRKIVHAASFAGNLRHYPNVVVRTETFPRDKTLDISLDFGALKDIFKFLDHKMLVSERDELFLNSDLFEPEGVVVMPGRNPSVENVALYGMNQVIDVLAKHFQKR